MKKFTILLTFWMLGCKTPIKPPPPPPPPPKLNRLVIDYLEVGKLVGVEKEKPQSNLILSTLEIDASQNSEQQGNVLIVRKAATQELIFKDGLVGQLQQTPPFEVSNLNFGTVIVKKQNETFKFYNVNVTQFLVKEWVVTNPAPNSNRQTEEKREKMDTRIKQLENRIKNLPPSSALRNNPPEYDKYKRILDKVKEDIQNRYCTPEQIRIDKALLDKLDLVFDDLEQAADEKAITLKSVFGTGSYQLDESGKKKLQKIVQSVQERVKAKSQNLKPDMEIKIKIQITGYSDDQWIGESLQKELQLENQPIANAKSKVNYKVETKGSNELPQNELNTALSKKRVASITQYFKTSLSDAQVNDQSLGQTLPFGYNPKLCETSLDCTNKVGKPHPYACANRRICLISCAVHLDVKVPETMARN